MKNILPSMLLAASMALTIGCGGSRETEPATVAPQPEAAAAVEAAASPKSLYERLGGEAAIKSVVDEFVANVGADDRINKYFANADLERLKAHLVNQIGQASGGPQQYTGRDMKTTHTGMGVDDAAFNALVEDLVKALDKFAVPEQEKSELLGILGPMKADIVEK